MVKALKLFVTGAPSLLNSNCVLIVFLKQKVLGERFLLFSLKCVLSCNLKHEGRFVGHPPPPPPSAGHRALVEVCAGVHPGAQNSLLCRIVSWKFFKQNPHLLYSPKAGPVLTAPLPAPP